MIRRDGGVAVWGLNFYTGICREKKIKNHLLKNHSARKSETNVEAQVVQIKFCLHHSMEKEWGHKGG